MLQKQKVESDTYINELRMQLDTFKKEPQIGRQMTGRYSRETFGSHRKSESLQSHISLHDDEEEESLEDLRNLLSHQGLQAYSMSDHR
eukprot:UN12069